MSLPSTEQCCHGSLKRSCEICERDAEIKRLREALQYCVDNIQGIADGTDIPSIAIRERACALLKGSPADVQGEPK